MPAGARRIPSVYSQDTRQDAPVRPTSPPAPLVPPQDEVSHTGYSEDEDLFGADMSDEDVNVKKDGQTKTTAAPTAGAAAVDMDADLFAAEMSD